MSAKVLLVNLDSAEPSLIREMAAQGKLPTIARLLAKGTSLDIENLPGFGNGVFWPSLNTGVDPSWHGCYFLTQPKPPEYSLEDFNNEDFCYPPFWKALENENLHVAVIDPVESPMAGLQQGVEIAEWTTHRRTKPPYSSPPKLIDEVLERYGDDPLHGNANLLVRRGLSMGELSELSRQRISIKTDAMLELLDRQSWDLFSVTYPDSHDMGHLAWHLRNSDESLGPNPVKKSYQQLDEAVARLMEKVEPGGQTILVMGPGMDDYVSANHLLAEVLLAYQGQHRPPISKGLLRAARKLIFSKFVPERMNQWLQAVKRRAGHNSRLRAGLRYCAIPHNGNAGAVRISLAGRDPGGVVAAGQEYDDLCAELSERLLNLKDATGKKPLVSQVVKLHDYYSGPELSRLPDLMVVWHRDADTNGTSSPDIGVIKGQSETVRSGDHSIYGLIASDQPLRTTVAAPLDPTQVTPLLLAAVRGQAAAQAASAQVIRSH